MARHIEDIGHATQATKPFKLRRYDVQGGLPDPGQCIDAMIVVNDKTKPSEPARLALSNGAGWDFYVREGQAQVTPLVVQQMPQVDLSAMAREALTSALPEILSRQPKVLGLPQLANSSSDDTRKIADALLELSEHVNRLLRENADLTARLEFVERNALAKVDLRQTA